MKLEKLLSNRLEIRLIRNFTVMPALSPAALKIIHDYQHLPIDGFDVSAPYFNNRFAGVRAGLRVLIGKGSPEDIAEEALLISLRDKINLKAMTDVELKKFLVDNHLGIDCSGLAYYILDAESKALGKGALKNHLHFPLIKNPLRKLLAKLRPVENTGVATLAHDSNSRIVALTDAAPGDLICMLRTGPEHDYDHILLIHQVDTGAEKPTILSYTHALRWNTDGRYNHGVRQGQITIKNPVGGLLDQTWIESSESGIKNETLERAKHAEQLEIWKLKNL